MDINQSTIMYFSPTGSTRKIVHEIASAINADYQKGFKVVAAATFITPHHRSLDCLGTT